MNGSKISETTIEALSRNFFKEAASYGFKYEHYLKFVNTLLDFALNGTRNEDSIKSKSIYDRNHKTIKSLPIISEKLSIRAYNPKIDKKKIKEWLNDDYGRYFLISLSSLQQINIDDVLNSKENILGVITLPGESPIGLVAFLHYDSIARKAELRKLIGVPELRGKGLGKEATKLWIDYGITGLELRKIYLNTVDTNIRNIKINEDLGFKVEGILRDEVLIDGIYHDVLRMGFIIDNT